MATEQNDVDALIRHQVYLTRFGSGLANRVLDLMSNDELSALILSKKKFQKKIKELIKKEKKRADNLITSELRQMAKIELAFSERLAKDLQDLKYTSGEIDSVIELAVNKPLVVTNNTTQDLYDSAFERKEQIATSLDSMNSLDIKDIATINAEMVAMFSQFANSMQVANQTFTMAVSNEMREEVFQQSKVIEYVLMSAVLDGRTTPYCRNIDGEKFPNGEGPRPPFHPRCRTVGIPLIEGTTDEEIKELLSFRSQIGPGKEYEKGDAKKLRSTKAQIEKGKTKVKTEGKSGSDYSTFLASQINTSEGKLFIKDVLGKKKGNAFIDLVKQGKDPNKLLKELDTIKAKDLDIDSLKKKSAPPKKKKKKKTGGGSSTPPVTAAPEPSFVPAKTIEDTLTSRATPTPSGVYLEGATKKQQQSILDGLNDSVVKYGGKLNSVGWQQRKRRSYGVASRSGDYIQFQKSASKTKLTQKKQKEAHENYLKRTQQNIDKLESDLKDPKRANVHRYIEEKLNKYKNVDKWATFSVADDPLKAVALHEGFHNVMFTHDIENRWSQLLRSKKVPYEDKLKVSEYGASKDVELFAEVGSAIELGIKIPKDIEDAFNIIIKDFKR